MNHHEEFNKRRNINTEIDPEIEFTKLKQGFLNSFDYYIEKNLDSEVIRMFIQRTGSQRIMQRGAFADLDKSITLYFERSCLSINDFCYTLELLIDIIGEVYEQSDRHPYVDNFEDFIKNVLPYRSLDTIFEIKKQPFRIITYPKGEEILDKELVNQPLSFLDTKSNELFIEGLKEYHSGQGYKSAEMLRKCIEEFLRHKLGNTKNLENNKKELLQGLSKSGGNKYIINIAESIFSKLEDCFNNVSKHKTEILSDQENEFLIYQVGLLLRYINRQI